MKRALVTGGSGGIGAAICRRLAADGHHVIVHANRSLDKAAAVVGAVVDPGLGARRELAAASTAQGSMPKHPEFHGASIDATSDPGHAEGAKGAERPTGASERVRPGRSRSSEPGRCAGRTEGWFPTSCW